MAGIGQLGSSASACCVAGALALHALVAGVVLSAPHDKKILLPTGGGAPVVHTRLLSFSSDMPRPSAPLPSPRVASDRTVQSSTAPVATTAQAEASPSTLLPVPIPLAAAESVPSPQPMSKPPLDDYFPRDLLTQAPSASQPILLDFPADLPDEQRLSIVLRLYVDEQGVVRRVARVGGDSQEQAQTIAEQAFLQARFNPGEIEGHPVKSIIHVEVTFDSTSLDPAR